MFLPWTLFILNIVLAIFQFILVLAVEAVLGIYSSFGNKYATSIRWAHRGGLVEMAGTLANSRRGVPITTTIVLSIAIISNIVANLADKGVSYSIHPSTRLGKSSIAIVNSTQYSSLFDVSQDFSGWSTSIRYGSSIEDAMTMMINNTKNIPNAANRKIYTPHRYDYRIACNRFDVHLLIGSDLFSIKNNGCTSIGFASFAPFPVKLTEARTRKISDARWSITVPGNTSSNASVLSELTSSAFMARETRLCGIQDDTSSPIEFPVPGVTSFPRTITTKCVLPTGDVRVLSMTSVRFMSPTIKEFRNSSAVAIEEYDELFQGMERSINNNTFSQSISNFTLFVEARSYASTIEALVCYTTLFNAPRYNVPSGTVVGCGYSIINGFLLERQDVNQKILASLGNVSYPLPEKLSKLMSIDHLLDLDQGKPLPVSINSLRNSTIAASEYMASLGQNFYPDYQNRKLYVIYDIRDIEQGFEITDWVLYTAAAVMAGCLLLVVLTTLFLDGIYTNSFYEVVATGVGPHIDSSAPMLMQSKVNPLELEGFSVLDSGFVDDIDENIPFLHQNLDGGVRIDKPSFPVS